MSVPEATVATNLNQPLDVHLNFAAKITFNLISPSNEIAQRIHFRFAQVFYPRIGVYAGGRQDRASARRANAINIGQANFNPLIPR
jgi:hypothetical protein